MNRIEAESLPDSALVWFESRYPARPRWHFWGWKKVENVPIQMGKVRIFMLLAAAPFLMRGGQFRVRKAK